MQYLKLIRRRRPDGRIGAVGRMEAAVELTWMYAQRAPMQISGRLAKFAPWLIVALGSIWTPAQAALNVFACEPEWASLATELGGDQVDVYSATTALQDPHLIQARPGLIARMRNADLAVCTGAELELGWMPVLQTRANNSRVQPGQPGMFEASRHVEMLDVPVTVDRSQGDIHPYGNPHIQMSPHNIARIASALTQRLAEIDPGHADDYHRRHDDFARRWQAAIERWEEQARPLRDVPVISDHKGWTYLYAWLGMVEVATLEPKPGIPPSAGYLKSLLQTLDKQPARMILRAAYYPERPAQWLAQRSQLPVVKLPFTVGGVKGADDLFGLFDVTIERLLKGLQPL